MSLDRWQSTAELEEFLGTFLKTYPCEAVAEVTYCPTKEKKRELGKKYLPFCYWGKEDNSIFWESIKPPTVASTFLHPFQLGLMISMPILLYPAAVSYPREELVSIIRDHEYVHAQDWFGTIPINEKRRISLSNDERLSHETINAIMEVRAYAHQLDCTPNEWEDRRIYQMAFRGYAEYHSQLEQIRNTTENKYEKRLISDFLMAMKQSSSLILLHKTTIDLDVF